MRIRPLRRARLWSRPPSAKVRHQNGQRTSDLHLADPAAPWVHLCNAAIASRIKIKEEVRCVSNHGETADRFENSMVTKPSIFTIGHSTRSINDFIELLRAHDVGVVVDVRTIPKSHHNPQFNQEELKQSLRQKRIRYLHIQMLGGLRHARKASTNLGWRNASFRGFADLHGNSRISRWPRTAYETSQS